MKKTISILGLSGLIGLSLEGCRTYEPLCPAYTKHEFEYKKSSQNQDYKYQTSTSQINILYIDERRSKIN